MLLLISIPGFSQNNVGIGVIAPTEALTVDRGIILDYNNQNPGASLLNGIKFGNSASAIQTVGIGSNRQGAVFPFSLELYTANTRRMLITQAGLVGINAIPTSYFLEVGGTIRGTTLRSAGSIYAEAGSVISDNSVSAGTSVTAGTNITAGNTITATTGDIISTDGELKADGRGVVMSNSATRQKIIAYTATLSVNNLASGSSATGAINISGGNFTAAPTAYVGNVVTKNGDYYKATLVLENVTTSNITIRLVNLSGSPISFSDAQWKVLAIGAF